jgi:uncharacterized repeat protein (TIGR03803 family)
MDGTGYAVLHSFAPLTGSIWGNPINEDGARPQCRLLVSANSIYGVTYSGGKSLGTVFRLNSDGTGFTTLHRFGSASNDGAYPINGVLLSENFLYGATSFGGSKMGGTVFKLQTDGTQFENLHEFEDGVWPRGELILAGDSLFGATYATIFTMQTNGGGFTTLANFGVAENLALSGSTLYTAVPDNASGIVFAIGTDGSAYSEIYRFSAVSNNRPMMGGPHTNFDGAMPQGGVTVRSNILYGTTFAGGYYEGGTVFAVTILPHLSVTNSNDNLILGWPTNYAGIDFRSYAVQATTNLASGVWTANLPAPLIVNGQNTVTNPISRTQQFFRLAQ